MKPVFQTKFGGAEAPESEQGNCMAACLASLFEISLDDVPDFGGQITNGQWYITLSDWLRVRNLELVVTPAKGYPPPMGPYLLATKSTTLANPDDGHLVIAQNGHVTHNPHPAATLEGEPEGIWLLVVLDVAKMEPA